MHLENQRENLSAFEEALAFKAWLDQGIYRNATELARAINKSKGAVSQRMSITELPDVVFRALGDPRQLSLRSWRALCAMYSSDRRPVLLGRAEQLSEGFVEFKPASESEVMKIFRKLTEAAPSPTSKPEVRGFTLPSGTPLFSAKRTAKGYQIAFDSTGVAEDIQEAALEELERFLKERLT